MNDLSGTRIGRYHIIEQLGEGGMATVYRAYDTRLDCDVAIKFIRNDKLVPKSKSIILERFRIEAQKTAQLSHPNIVPVIDYGEYEDQPYLVMKYIPGGTLKEILRTPLHYKEAVKLLVPIAYALEAAHKKNLVHRDVKPSNILITDSNQPMLSDFGVAKVLDAEQTTDGLTGTGIGIGTPDYMAPEQWEGKTLDSRADIYALGVVFYEMLTGRRPFQAETVPAIMVKALRDPLPNPRKFAKNIPVEAERILYKALARNPHDRYESMVQFANDLENLSNGSRSSFRRPWLVPALGGIAGLFIIAIIGLFVSQIKQSNSDQEFPATVSSASISLSPSPSAMSIIDSSPIVSPTQIRVPTKTDTPSLPENKTYLGDLKPETEQVGFGRFSVGNYAFNSPEDNVKEGTPIRYLNKNYNKGLYAHSPSKIVYSLAGSYSKFHTSIFVASWCQSPDGVIFRVQADDKEVFTSSTIFSTSPPKQVELEVDGIKTLTLITDPGVNKNRDCDWAIWGDPYLVISNTSSSPGDKSTSSTAKP